jgi:hypothetical protein
MYLSVRVKCPSGAFFDLPHKPNPWPAKRIIRRYPEFAKIFDGKSLENTLSFYYKKDKETGVYSFIDTDCEEEVAELLGVQVKTFEVFDEDAPTHEARPLDEGDITNFRSHMSDIRTGIDWLNKQGAQSSSESSNSSSDSDSDSDSSDSE